jgi:PKD repeat protein
MRRVRVLVAALSAAVVVWFALVPLTPASADTAPSAGVPATVSADPLPTWQINGVVWSQTLVGNTVYAVGSFTKARPPGVAAGGAGEIDAGNIFAYDIRTGNPVSGFNHSLNAQGLAVTASPDGSRIYIGGDFTAVDGMQHSHVAAFNTATGALDNSFTANVSNKVQALTAASSALYIGGGFGSVNGSTRDNLAAVSSSTGALLPWNRSADNGAVWSMVLAPDGSRVIVGGSFTALSGTPAYGMGSISTSGNGAIMPWEANQTIRDAGRLGAITSLRTDGSQIFGTGYSFDIPTANFEGTFAADPNTGKISVVNDCHGDSYDILPLGPVMYSVGHVHDCTAVGSFPDTNPRVRWQHALAQTIAPTGTNVGPDVYGWNFNGLPDSTLLHWFPSITAGTYTGQGQAAWSLAGNSDYVVFGGEFPKVNGAAQQGLTRMARSGLAPNKRGPSYTTNPDRPIPATTAVSFAAGTARVGFGTAWDYDNESLTYDVFRDNGGTPIYSTTIKSNFWTLPTAGFNDTGLAPGSTHTYQVRIADPFGNVQWSPKSNAVTISSGSQSQYAKDVAADGASHYWRLGEPSGTTAYDWTGFDDVTLNSGVTHGAAGAITGDADGASTFDGNSGNGVDPNAIPGPNRFSQEAWFRTTSTTGGKIVSFGDQPTGFSSSYDRHIYMDAAGRVYFGVYNNGVYTTRTNSALNDGQWHHVVGTLDGTGMTLYVDGKKVGHNGGTTQAQPYSGYWRIGGDNINGWGADGAYFNGDIDDVAIYPTSLTLDQVQKHYTDSGRTVAVPPKPTDSYGLAVYNSGPDSYWRLGDTSGPIAKDTTSNEANGIYSGGVTFGTAGGVSGTTDTAVTLNGVDGAVAAGVPVSNPTVYSEELWFKTTTTQGGKLIGFGSSQTGLSGAYDRHVYMFDDGRLRFGVWTGFTNVADTSQSYNDGTWHHMVATQGADGMKLYVDGVLAASNPQTESQAYDGYWRVGGDNTWGGNSSNYFAGSIDEVAVYSTAMTASTVQAHYRAGGGSLPNTKPTASFTSSVSDLKASFVGTGSSDSDGTIAAYSWNFGDNSAAGSGATPSHTYAAAGTYTVTLTVTDDAGATDTISHDVTVTAPPNQKPTAAFTSAVTDLNVALDGTGSADPDGFIASYAWDFGDNTAVGSGSKPSHAYTATGTYLVTLTVTDNVGATDTVSHSVTVTAPSPIIASDAFNRTVSNGWGTADVGGAWTNSSTASNFNVVNGAGTIKTSAAAGPSAYLNGVSASDVDLTASFGYDKVGTGTGAYTALVARKIGTSNYWVKIQSNATSTTIFLAKNVNGTETTLANQVVSGMVYAPGDVLNLRFQVQGTGTTTLRAKIWKTGTTEPSTWRLTATDTTAALQNPGAVGVWSYLSGSATNSPVTLIVQDFAVQRL